LQGWWHTFPCHRLSLRPTHFLSKSWSHVPTHIQHNTVLTPSQVLPLPLLQSRRGTTLHCIHPPTSDDTALITTSCVLFYFISPFSSFKVVFEEPLPHLPPLHRDHCHGVRKRDDHTTPSAGTQATTPPSHPSLSPHTRHRHCLIRRHASYVFFFSFFFVPFLTNITETLFTPHARSSYPCLFTT